MMENSSVTLSDLLAVIAPEEKLLVLHRLGPHECEVVVEGTMQEIMGTRCIEVCGDNAVESIEVAQDEQLDAAAFVIVVTIGGKAGEHMETEQTAMRALTERAKKLHARLEDAGLSYMDLLELEILHNALGDIGHNAILRYERGEGWPSGT